MLSTATPEPRFLLGIMCGTSGDGMAGSLIATEGFGSERTVTLVGQRVEAYSTDLRDALFALYPPHRFSAAALAEIHRALGELLADFSMRLLEACALQPSALTGVGVQAPTLIHVPPGEATIGVHMEIGEAAIIAERLGVRVVCDLRPSDIAAGGHGAPLSAFVDYCLLALPDRNRAVQNIGGIANVTYLRAGGSLEDVIAFDTGPGNMLVDGVVKRLTSGRSAFDQDGAWAASGRIDQTLLDQLMAHPYLAVPIPKTTGREDFGDFLAEEILRSARAKSTPEADLVATVTAFTAETIRHHYERDLLPLSSVDEVVLYGGGAHNRTLVRYLAERLPGVEIVPHDRLGIPVDARESVTWAILADETLAGHAANVPSASGARRRVVLGKVVDPRPSEP